ncbi:hypothetical protein Gpo141_00007522 [Globisporangium polare]
MALHLQSPSASLMTLQLLLLSLFSWTQPASAAEIDTASNTVESIFNSAKGVKVGGSILAILAIAAGLFVCFAGYKLFRTALFVVGFVAGGVLLAIAAEHIFDTKSWVVTASWVAFVVGGLLVGCLVVSLYTTSIFVAGAAGGVLLAILLNTSVGYKIYPSNPNVVLIVLAIILGIVGGVLALKLEKPVLIVATSLVGAGMLVWGVGYFAGDYPSPSDLKQFAQQDNNGNWVYDIPTAWWAYVAGMLVLFVIGMVVQFRKTGKGGDYHRSHALPSRHAAQQQEQLHYGNVNTPQQQHGDVRYGNPISHV